MSQAQTLERVADGSPGGSRLAAAAGASRIHFEGISVTYGETTVLEGLTLTVNPGEIVALIGPSGSGKTTALRAVAGFVRPSAGRISIGARDVTDIAPHERNIGMVVQNYALFPHMTVAENVAFGLRARHAASRVVAERVPACLDKVGMSAYVQRYAWRSPVPLPSSPRCCCSTSRSPRSTPRSAAPWWTRSPVFTAIFPI